MSGLIRKRNRDDDWSNGNMQCSSPNRGQLRRSVNDQLKRARHTMDTGLDMDDKNKKERTSPFDMHISGKRKLIDQAMADEHNRKRFKKEEQRKKTKIRRRESRALIYS